MGHPGYPSSHNVLLVLGARDHANGSTHHETARIDCGMFAGNRWDGYFTERLNESCVITPRHGILLKERGFLFTSLVRYQVSVRKHFCCVPNNDNIFGYLNFLLEAL